MTEESPSKILKPEDLAQHPYYIPIATQNVYRCHKKIPYHKRGRHIFYFEDEIYEWIKAAKVV